jgi:hypothetical protein
VARVDPVNGDEAEAQGVPAWAAAVVAPDDGERWAEARAGCDPAALRAIFTGGGPAREVLLPIAPRLGDRTCAEPARAIPVAWGPRGLEAIVDGEPLLFAPDLARATIAAASLDQPWQPGAPRSPSGKVLVVPTSQGVFVRNGGAMRTLRAKELDGGYMELRGCAVSDDAARVACVRGGRAFVGVWDVP